MLRAGRQSLAAGKSRIECVLESRRRSGGSGFTEDLTDTEWQIGETMAEVLRERLVELETLEAAGDATEDTVSA